MRVSYPHVVGTMEIKEANRCDDRPPSTKDPDGDSSTSSCRSSLSPPTAAVTDPRCRRSSPLLSVLLASVGDHHDDDVNAQSILEDHLLRVWDESTAAAALSTTTSDIPCRCRQLRDEAVDVTDSRGTRCSRDGPL